jgi:serine/threonine protein kinase
MASEIEIQKTERVLIQSRNMDRAIDHCPQCNTSIDVSALLPLSEVSCPHCISTFFARRQFVNFQIESKLGEGGMGTVYKAYDISLGRYVALKVLREEFCQDAEYIARLNSEAQITASINHPHVVKVLNTGACHGMYFIAFELLTKGSLSDLIRRVGQVPETHAVQLGIQIASGLKAALQEGLIHRDIKPGNLLLIDERTVKIIDFGIARRISEGNPEETEIWASAHYMAPEKLSGVEDFRSDIYSLGATLFHAFTGRPPFEGKDSKSVLLKHANSKIVSVQAFAPSVSNITALCITRMLQKAPDERFQRYDDVIANLQHALDPHIPAAIAPSKLPRSGTPPDRPSNRFRALVVTLIALPLLLLSGFLLREKGRSPKSSATTTPPLPKSAGLTFAKGVDRLAEQDTSKAEELFQQTRSNLKPESRDYILSLVLEGLAYTISSERSRALLIFRQLRDFRATNHDPAAQMVERFANDIGSFMIEDKVVARDRTTEFDRGDYRALGLLAAGIRNVELSFFDDGVYFLRRFSSASIREDVWVNNLKVVAQTASSAYVELDHYGSSESTSSTANDTVVVDGIAAKYPFLKGKAAAVLKQRSSKLSSPALSPLTNLRYQLYKGNWQSVPDFSKLRPAYEASIPENLIQVDGQNPPAQFAMIFSGTLNVPSTGEYIFYLASDDGSRLIIDDRNRIDKDGIHSATEIRETKVELTQGSHSIRVDYFQGEGSVELYLAWKGPGFDLTPLSRALHPSWRGHITVPTRDMPGMQVLSLWKPARQSSVSGWYSANNAVDGNRDGHFHHGSVAETEEENQPWWEVDLGGVYFIDHVLVYNRTDCCGERQTDFHVFVSSEPFSSTEVQRLEVDPQVTNKRVPEQAGSPSASDVKKKGRYVRIQLRARTILSLAEVEVVGTVRGE